VGEIHTHWGGENTSGDAKAGKKVGTQQLKNTKLGENEEGYGAGGRKKEGRGERLGGGGRTSERKPANHIKRRSERHKKRKEH